MSGRWFDDLLEDTHKMMGYDPYEDPEDTDPWRDMSYKVKGEPKKGITVKHALVKEAEYANGKREVDNATCSNVEWSCDSSGMEAKLEWSQTKMKVEIEK